MATDERTREQLELEVSELRRRIAELTADAASNVEPGDEYLLHIRFLANMARIDRAVRQNDNAEEMLGEVLEVALAVFGCDRAWLLSPCDPEAPTWRVPIERTRPEHPGAMASGEEFPMTPDVAAGFQKVLAATGPLTAKLQPGEAGWDPGDQYGVRSTMAMALRPKIGKAWEFGLHQCADARTWSEQEQGLFQEIGNRLTDGLTSVLLLRDLRQSEEKFRTLVESTSDWIWETDAAGLYTYSSPQVTTMLGYLPEEIVGRTPFDLMPPEEAGETARVFADLVSTRAPIQALRNVALHKNGSRVILETSGVPILDQGGKLAGYRGVDRDITERDRAEEQLLEARNLLEAAVAQSPSGILIADAPDATIRMANPAALGMRGGNACLLTGIDVAKHSTNWQTFRLDGSPYPAEQLPLSRAILQGETTRNEQLTIRDEEGEDHCISTNAAPIRNATGEIVAGIVVFHDVTEHKRAERKLLATTSFLDTIVELSPFPMWIADPSGAIIRTNRALRETLVLADAQMVGKYNVLADTNLEAQGLLDQVRDVFGKHEPARFTMSCKAVNAGEDSLVGTRDLFIDVAMFPILDAEGQLEHVVCQWLDMTDRRRAEEQLQAEQAFSNAIIQSMPGLFYVFRADTGLIMRHNGNLREVTGYSAEELETMTALDFVVDRELCAARVQEVFEKGWSSMENGLLTKSGDQIPHYFTGAKFEANGKAYLVGMAVDITDRKRAEEEVLQLERQIQQAQKLESLGVLAGGIAHDFNNLLMAILGNAELALTYISPVSPARDNIDEISKASQRAAELAKQMLAYSGKGRFVVQALDLSELVEEMAHMLEVSVSKKAVLRYELANGLPAVEADASQIRQVVMNLISNASDAIGDRNGVISIATGLMDVDRSYLQETYIDEELPEGPYVTLEVADTGCGMDAETQGKLFDPFFTTKFTGRGLGMAAVLGIVRGHEGAIKAYSELGRGTTMKILLPAVGPPAVGHGNSAKGSLWQGSGTVLLADDEESVRVVGKAMLERLGMEVVLASDGVEAVKIYREQTDAIDCVILDLTMPHMDGEEAYRELRRIRNNVRIIMSSGYNQQEVTQRFVGKGLGGFIQKPYTLHALAVALRNVLGEGGRPETP